MNFAARVREVFPDWQYGNPPVMYGLIRSMRPYVCVEVGTYLGFGAAWMAQALRENGHGRLYVIDNFGLNDRARQGGNPRKHFEDNMAALGLSDLVTVIEGDTDKVQWPDQIEVAYIDAWHGYLAVKHDFEQCAKRGAECIGFDDTTQSVGPRMLLEEIRRADEWDVMDIRRDCGMSLAMRRIPKGSITFSQELPNCPGVDLQTLTHKGQLAHLFEAGTQNGVSYGPILDVLCEGRRE